NELDGGTAPGLAVIFARAQGLDIKIVAGICLEADGKDWVTTAYMVKDDAPVKSVKDLKGGTAGVLGFKTATDLWVRAALLDAGLVPDRDVKVGPIPFPAMGGAVRTAHSRRALLFRGSGQGRSAHALHRGQGGWLRPRAFGPLVRREILEGSARRRPRLSRRLRRGDPLLPGEPGPGQARHPQGGLRPHAARASSA